MISISGKFSWYDEVKDVVTNFKGKVVGYCKYSTGCLQVLVVPEVSKKEPTKQAIGTWFDEDRLTLVSPAKVSTRTKNAGRDIPPERTY